MPFQIVRGDITKLKADAIVNAANTRLQEGGGVCGAIFAAAGARELQRECDAIGRCGVGDAVITSGGGLPARYIIHAVGPVWRGGGQGEEALLRSCYTRALGLALEHGCASAAFPLISSGIYGYPKDQALRVAVSAMGDFLMDHDMEVTLVVFDRASYSLGSRLFSAIRTYIDDRYVEDRQLRGVRKDEISIRLQEEEQIELGDVTSMLKAAAPCPDAAAAPVPLRTLDDVVKQLDESFSQMLLRLIDQKGMTDVEVYKRANLDRKLFSKIRSAPGYQPSKATALALAVALRLSLDETRDLLGRAGFALSHSSKSDLILEYFIQEGSYNIFEINEALFAFDQKLLGA